MNKKENSLNEPTEEYVKNHIRRVQLWIFKFSQILKFRGLQHDKSKLEEPEISGWRKMDEEPRYKYGTFQYEDKKRRFEYLFKMHWKNNRHHPEYFELNKDPTRDLIDLIEMLCDWLGYRDNISYTEASNLVKQQCKRYNFSEEIEELLLNTLSNWFVSFGGYKKDSIPKLEHLRKGNLIDTEA